MFSAVTHTSCDSFSFDYQWTVKKLKTLVGSGVGASVNCESFSPGFNLGSSRARFVLNFQALHLKHDFVSHTCPKGATEQTSSQCTCVKLQVTLNYTPASRCFSEGSLSLRRPISPDLAIPAGLKDVHSMTFEPDWINSGEKSVSVEVSEVELKAGCSKYTYDDSLTVYCKMTVHMVNSLKHTSDSFASVPQTDFRKVLNENRKNNVYTDVTIVCGDRKFEVHRIVISPQSAFFKAKLQRWETGEKTIDMSDLDPQIVEVMIDYMYTGKTSSISYKVCPDLLAACNKYQLSALKCVCENELIRNVTSSNALFLLKLASAHNADYLKRKASDVISTRPIEIAKALTC